MVYAGLIFAGLAALLHVYIWVMESLTWTSARTRATFGITEDEALATKELAFNQGFYNLFLAIITVTGLVIGGTLAGIGVIFEVMRHITTEPLDAKPSAPSALL